MVVAFAFYGMIEFLPDWYRVKVGRKGYVRYKQTDEMSFFNTISKNDVVFLTPLIVATAPLFLPYILLCKTQGRSVNTFDNGNREVCVPPPLCGVSNRGGGTQCQRGSPREDLCRYFGAMFNSNGVSGVYPLRILHSCG